MPVVRWPATLRIVAVALALGAPGVASAEPWVFQHDEFSSDLSTAVDQINGGQFYTQPGFVAGEAFGQVYKPTPEMYPLRVTGFDLVLAAPPNATEPLYANATIEIYNSSSTSADPQSQPIFSISTADLYNAKTQTFGVPLQGNTAIKVDFDDPNADPADRPPMITSGNVWLVVRFTDPARDMSTEWDIQCAIISLPELGLETCGCQNVGTVHDNDLTGKANVMNIVTPVGTCSGTKSWMFMENVGQLASGFQIDGDVILRMHADVASTPCVPQCDGKDCGDDTCGGSCGSCGALTCYQGACVTCAPNCLSKQCGDDGCGGSCGSCGTDSECGGDFFCHAVCHPACNGKECGSDGCGGSCGSCSGGEACQAGQCTTGCAPDCDGKDCGPDGCGGVCGTCTVGTCQAGVCGPDCEPFCAGKDCGNDGCGGSCGTCGDGQTCQAGTCVTGEAPALTVTSISPHSVFAGETTAVSIVGTGFAAGDSVKLGGYDLSNINVTSAGLISATVPPLSVGTYSVIVANSDGVVATLPDAFTVTPRDPASTSGSSGGCASGSTPALWAVALAFLALRRRRLPKV
ncbi:MAG: IPT/TIG domain-containing protein [Myxococcota bacterium]